MLHDCANRSDLSRTGRQLASYDIFSCFVVSSPRLRLAAPALAGVASGAGSMGARERKIHKMAKLNQIIAVEKGVKSQSFQELTEAHQALQKPTLLAGIARTYRPKDEEGEQLPPESTRVQLKAEAVIAQTTESLTRLFDITATKDWANCKAKADVVVDGQTLLSAVPA